MKPPLTRTYFNIKILLKPIDLVRDPETVIKARASSQPLVGCLLLNVISVRCSPLKLSWKMLLILK